MLNSETEIFYTIVAGGLLALFLAAIIIISVVKYQRRQKKNEVEKKQMQVQFSQELLQSQLEIQEQTLKNISQEIHDNIGQVLSLAKLNLNTMSVDNVELLQQKITNSKKLVSKAIVDLRDLSRSLNTDYVADMGLQRAIEYELELISKSATIKTNLVVEGQVSRMDKQKELILFRIVQEALNNIIKHAKAQHILVTTSYNTGELVIVIKDDGKGIANEIPDNGNITSGIGLRNMHNRAKLIGADFKIDSNPGNGTAVKLSISLKE